MKRDFFLLVVLCLAVIAPLVRAQEAEQVEREAMYYRYLEWPQLKGGSIQPQWMADGSSFWYAEGSPANTVIYKVDPRANTKTPLFDTTRLRKALASVLAQLGGQRRNGLFSTWNVNPVYAEHLSEGQLVDEAQGCQLVEAGKSIAVFDLAKASRRD